MPVFRGPPGANIAKISAIDAIDSTGRLGGRLCSPDKLTQLEGYIARRGITLRVGEEFAPAGTAGAFDYGKGEVTFLSDRTQYEVWQDLSHFRQYQKLGKAAYAALPRSKYFNAPEKYVFEALENSPKRWSKLNFEHPHTINVIEYIGVQIMIDEVAARENAERFIARHDLKRHVYRFLNVKSTQRRPDEWGVVFEVYSPENALIDGPVVVIVNKLTGDVKFL